MTHELLAAAADGSVWVVAVVVVAVVGLTILTPFPSLDHFTHYCPTACARTFAVDRSKARTHAPTSLLVVLSNKQRDTQLNPATP